MVNSVVHEEVAYKQIDDMEHAIGFDNRKVCGTRHRRYEPHRNYFDAGPRGSEDWEQLVPIGSVTKSGRHWYHISDDERLSLKRVTGVEILPESN